MMKFLGCSVLLFALLGAAALDAGEEAALKIKPATLAPRGSVYHQILQGLAEKWQAAPGGGVKLVIFPDASQGSESDMIRKMRTGQIQAALITASGMAEIDESVNALQNMPLVFRSLAEVEEVRQRLRPLIAERFLGKGFVLLALEDAGWVKFFCKKPAVLPADLQRLKLFALSSDIKALEIWRTAGFTPVPMDTVDMVTGLTTSRIEAVPAPPTYANAMQIFSHAPHMIDLNWAPLVGGLVVKKEAWEKIPEAMREPLRCAAEEAGKLLLARTRQENNDAVEAMKKRGLQVHAVDAAAEAAWRESVEKCYPMIRGKIVPADLYDEVMKILQNLRSQGETGQPAK